MNLKPLLLIPSLSLVLLLSACAGPMPKQDPGEAWIGLKEEGNSDLMAERVDGKTSTMVATLKSLPVPTAWT